MTIKGKKLYEEQTKLTIWFAILTGICLLLLTATYFWWHSVLLLTAVLMFGPIFLMLTLVFGALAISSRMKSGK